MVGTGFHRGNQQLFEVTCRFIWHLRMCSINKHLQCEHNIETFEIWLYRQMGRMPGQEQKMKF